MGGGLAPAAPASAAPAELPRGGRTILPGHVVVAQYGTAGTPVLGVLGRGTPAQAAVRAEKAAAPFARASGQPALPALELITTVARQSAGPSGTYSAPLDPKQVQRYLTAARKAKQLLVLDFQPGRADFLDQVRQYEQFLVQPEVGVALDPEWKLTASQRPGRQVGHTDAAAVNRVSAYLSKLVAEHDLPQKLFVVHQFRASMIRHRDDLVARDGLATVVHVDGFGTPADKRRTYHLLAFPSGAKIYNGFKLFYKADTRLLTPKQTMALLPQPELVTYQ